MAYNRKKFRYNSQNFVANKENKYQFFHSGVVVGQNEDIETALKRFRKSVENDGILSELKKRNFFVKPSEKKREKNKQVRFRRKKDSIKNNTKMKEK